MHPKAIADFALFYLKKKQREFRDTRREKK
jgi:hypothetical protein